LSRGTVTFTGRSLSVIPTTLSRRRRSFVRSNFTTRYLPPQRAAANVFLLERPLISWEIGALTCIAYTIEIKARDALADRKSRT
jgi:hypothetical protein